MRWFKHFTDSLDDPFIQELLVEFGANGYLAYFGIIEIIAKENKNNLTGKLTVSPTFLKQKLHISSGKLQEIFRFCSGKGKLIFNFSQENFDFDFPKIAEIKDNYSKDLQGACKKLSNQKEVEVEVEVEVEKKNIKKKINKDVYGKFENVKLTDIEYQELVKEFTEPGAKSRIENLSSGIASKGYKYKSHYATILSWERKNNKEQIQPSDNEIRIINGVKYKGPYKVIE